MIATTCCALLLAAMLAAGCSWFGGGGGKPASRAPARVQAAKALTCPLCGLVPADPTFISRRPVAVKVENDPAARPQSGFAIGNVVLRLVKDILAYGLIEFNIGSAPHSETRQR